jgi:hypothetical protein
MLLVQGSGQCFEAAKSKSGQVGCQRVRMKVVINNEEYTYVPLQSTLLTYQPGRCINFYFYHSFSRFLFSYILHMQFATTALCWNPFISLP